MIKEIKIYDMDGTIVDSSHRYKTVIDENGIEKIDLPFWRENDIPEMIAKDSLLPLAEEYKRDLMNPEIYVIIATARACSKNDANYQYIKNMLGMPNKFVHREGIDDSRGGAHLKIQAIKPLLNLKQFKNAIVKIFEDNQKYLQDISQSLNAIPVYIPSNQGH